MKTATLLAWIVAITIMSPMCINAMPIDDPFGYFNVYSLMDISYTGSDFEGKAGAARDANFSSFSLALKDQGGYALHAGRNVSLGSGTYYGSVEAGQNISAKSMTVYGDLYSGNNINWTTGGTVTSGAYASGTVSTPAYYNRKHAGTPYDPVADLNSISNYFSGFSTKVGAMANTGLISESAGGYLTIQAVHGINVFSIDAAKLYAASTFTINGPDDAIVYINALGVGSVALDAINWIYNNGISAGDVLLNYSQSTVLALSSSNNVNILAPFADTTFTSGKVTGNLIVGDLDGNGQVNLGHFEHGESVPEPSTLLLLLVGGAFFLLRRNVKRKQLTT